MNKYKLFLTICYVLILYISSAFISFINAKNQATLLTPNGHINVEVADTLQKRLKGLSNRQELRQNNGMLFVYPNAGNHSIWMKDMYFPIDIIWLDKEKRVIHILENIKPETYNKNNPVIYKPNRQNAWFVLELPAKDSKRLGIKKGDELLFKLIK